MAKALHTSAAATDPARAARQQAVAALRRSSVLAAARSAFLELGLEGASLREIARRAGYTPGALYSYFQNKEEVYGALLGESLERLNAFVDAAAVGARTAQDQVRQAATAFFDFYRENPRDLDLGFYLFHGMQPRGLTPALNERLNARLRDALHQLRVARTEGLAGGQLEAPPLAFVQADQAGLERRCQLAGAQRQRGRLGTEGVDHVLPVGARQAVMQGEKRAGLDAIHGVQRGRWRLE